MIESLLAAYKLRRDVEESTLEHYHYVLRSFQKFLGREITATDWTAEAINGFLLSLKATHSPWTVKQRRISMRVLWRAASELSLAAEQPTRLRNVKTPDRVITTWTPDQVAQLVEHAEGLSGYLRNTSIPRAVFWAAWIRVGYDTGLRQSDIFLLEAEDVINSGGRLTIVQKKTRYAVRVGMRPETMASCRLLSRYTSRYLFPRLWTYNHFCRAFTRFARSAGLDGTATKLRQSSCTEVELMAPGTGWIHLGHRNPVTTLTWYIDRARAHSNRPLPPLPKVDRRDVG